MGSWDRSSLPTALLIISNGWADVGCCDDGTRVPIGDVSGDTEPVVCIPFSDVFASTSSLSRISGGIQRGPGTTRRDTLHAAQRSRSRPGRRTASGGRLGD